MKINQNIFNTSMRYKKFGFMEDLKLFKQYHLIFCQGQ